MTARSLVVLHLLLASAYTIPTPEKPLADEVNYRLPTSVVPTKYTLELNFTDSVFTKDGSEFTGTVTIDFDVKETISEIKLHAAHDFISINKLTLNNLDLEEEREDFTIDAVTDILSITTEGTSITIGNNYRLVIIYTGRVSTTDNYGIYKSSYINAKNETVYLLTTQFEPSRARRAFPCFDEPAFKALFDVSVIYPTNKNLGVLFNSEVKSKEEVNGTNKAVFKTTPKMSSYLIALTISDFTSTMGENIDNVSYAVWSRDELSADREYAKTVGPAILQKLNEYTLRNYNLSMSKIDQVAAPVFSPGAMENWGLLIYREKLLLWNKDDPTSGKQGVATTIAHELSHQWFGDLITCNWWSETFLNEGFANYFQTFITHQVEPTWQLDKQFVLTVLQAVLEFDSLEGSLALQSSVSTPAEVSAKFGTISYSKGGSIIRMVSHIMGEPQFQKGIQDYVQSPELQYSTAVPSQLWEILAKNVTENSALPEGANLNLVMQNWVEKPGYPLLTVSLDGNTLKISQERFLTSGEDDATKWYVPITYVESADTDKFKNTLPKAWLTPEQPEINITLKDNSGWVLLNPQQTGYYRVNYDSNLWTKISAALQEENFGDIIDLNRAQIVDDLFTLAKSDKIEYSQVLDIVEFLKNDTSYFSWTPALKGFTYIWEKTEEGSEFREKLRNHLLILTDKFYNSVSLDDVKDDDQIYTATQLTAMSWACQLGQENCIEKAKTSFEAFKASGTKPNKNLRSFIYCYALKYSENATDYDFLWNLYTKTADATEKSILLSSLGCSNSDEKLKELLSQSIKSDEGSPNIISTFEAVYKSGSVKGVEVMLEFFETNMKAIFTRYSTVADQITLMSLLAEGLKNSTQIEKLRAMETLDDFPDELKEPTEGALKQAQTKLKWLEDHQEDLDKFYDDDDDTSSTTPTTPTSDDESGSSETPNTPTEPSGGGASDDDDTSSTTATTPTSDDESGSSETPNTPTEPSGGGASTIYMNMVLLAGVNIISIVKLFA